MTYNSENIAAAVKAYCHRHGLPAWHPIGALIDMDGVLYDSMPHHAAAWKQMTEEIGIHCPIEEFFLYEGMTGAATINLLFTRHKGREATAEEIECLYGRKAKLFRKAGPRVPMPGADRVLKVLMEHDVERVLVTGSAQSSLIDALEHDYPGAFPTRRRITALDVTRGKPHPEPYLKGLELLGLNPEQALVIENAPLGVQAGHAAGCFTIGVTTGPIPPEELAKAGADLVIDSMDSLADILQGLL